MIINIAPLKKYRDFRLLFFSQLISFLGSMITYMAVPYQIYDLTKSNVMVGLLGTAQLVPVVIFGLIGGGVADSMDRRKLLLVSEAIMSLGALGLAINAFMPEPSIAAIFILTVFMQAATGFHRPAMDALTQKLVSVEDLPSVGALGSFRYSVGSVAGPAIGGLLIAAFGAKAAFLVDFGSFLLALLLLAMMTKAPMEGASQEVSTGRILEGIRYALARPELMGTYIVDIVAMTFAFSTALFPAMSTQWGDAKAAGALYSAMSAGALIMTMFSGWTSKVRRHGSAVVWAAGVWGVAMIAFGYSPNLVLAVTTLAIAGAADMVSGLFRGVIWNETIPNEMRGRLAGIEMISYMTGPLLGNARAGWMAAATTTQISVVSGGILCVVGVAVCGIMLPQFWRYTSKASAAPHLENSLP